MAGPRNFEHHFHRGTRNEFPVSGGHPSTLSWNFRIRGIRLSTTEASGQRRLQ